MEHPEKHQLDELLSQLTLEEKASLCSGEDFWNLKKVERLGIPAIMVTDGPHGLRKQSAKADHVGLNESIPATCFPTASALASSWDISLVRKVGEALAEECLQENVAIILGPGANIKRSALCGRNFEYFSEDPFLSGQMAAAQIKGIQSRSIGASLKHFAVNNQETRRLTIDAVVDERALREIYLSGFEAAVIAAQPDTVMCAYNRVNGEYCSESHFLLSEILREEWGFEGLVLTDWGAVNDRAKGLAAGLDLEMPGSGGLNDAAIVLAVNDGSLPLSHLDTAVKRILALVLKTSGALKGEHKYDAESHHQLAVRAAAESSVLLKNEGILPLMEEQRIAVIGTFAESPRYQGNGSSKVNPWKLESALTALQARADSTSQILYAPGYRIEIDSIDDSLIAEAVKIAESSDVALVFVGLTEVYESEGFDRTTLDLPQNHNALIRAVSAANPKTVVILSNGAPVLMPWLDDVPVVLESYLGGQGWGSAITSLLYGDVNPSGKLAETFPVALADLPSSPNFPGGTASVPYVESLYVGYRYFDSAEITPLFPFGHGLSYTEFEYSDLQIGVPDDSGRLYLSFSLQNTGGRSGAEVVQLYVRDDESTVFRPEKELKGFCKVFLDPGEKRIVQMSLDRRAFAFWDTGHHDWIVEEGRFTLLIASSSRDIRLSDTVHYSSTDKISEWAAGLEDLVPEYYRPGLEGFSGVSNYEIFSKLYGKPLPPLNLIPGKPYSRTSVLADVRRNILGALLHTGIRYGIRKSMGPDEVRAMGPMVEAMVNDMPLRNMSTMSNGMFTLPMLDALLLMVNGHPFRGIAAMMRALRSKRLTSYRENL